MFGVSRASSIGGCSQNRLDPPGSVRWRRQLTDAPKAPAEDLSLDVRRNLRGRDVQANLAEPDETVGVCRAR
ncbi:hypothetical protein [Amycolatopsis alkalitolerans]|uniref:Uncharacterized protein n=1 Tax=Amycolatopsis alkalitolerans TaxID=2547244 RepID=A0A5C4M7I1_9PSEU|nr:hypothetical protein [Amycolatopsis alkalitolerans]TNC28935.1 hypothetical protein FG385_02130 [Amycolatopsis alkalitolerans]